MIRDVIFQNNSKIVKIPLINETKLKLVIEKLTKSKKKFFTKRNKCLLNEERSLALLQYSKRVLSLITKSTQSRSQQLCCSWLQHQLRANWKPFLAVGPCGRVKLLANLEYFTKFLIQNNGQTIIKLKCSIGQGILIVI